MSVACRKVVEKGFESKVRVAVEGDYQSSRECYREMFNMPGVIRLWEETLSHV